jgi:hypothetical protein
MRNRQVANKPRGMQELKHTSGSDDRVDVGMLLQGVHALFLVQVEADALLYQMVNLTQ